MQAQIEKLGWLTFHAQRMFVKLTGTDRTMATPRL
jgi:hypothetical protein